MNIQNINKGKQVGSNLHDIIWYLIMSSAWCTSSYFIYKEFGTNLPVSIISIFLFSIPICLYLVYSSTVSKIGKLHFFPSGVIFINIFLLVISPLFLHPSWL